VTFGGGGEGAFASSMFLSNAIMHLCPDQTERIMLGPS
jgi:hypothetical protein